jgi:hypothetical protein
MNYSRQKENGNIWKFGYTKEMRNAKIVTKWVNVKDFPSIFKYL